MVADGQNIQPVRHFTHCFQQSSWNSGQFCAYGTGLKAMKMLWNFPSLLCVSPISFVAVRLSNVIGHKWNSVIDILPYTLYWFLLNYLRQFRRLSPPFGNSRYLSFFFFFFEYACHLLKNTSFSFIHQA